MRDWRSLALGSLSVATGLIVWYLIGALGLVFSATAFWFCLPIPAVCKN
jgi:hypothetical protein